MPTKANETLSCVVLGAKSPSTAYVSESAPDVHTTTNRPTRQLFFLLDPQSNECQTSDWKYHKTNCTPAPRQELGASSAVPPQQILGVLIPCNADRARGARVFEHALIGPSHAIHTKGLICPLFHQVGFPLILFRHLADDNPASEAVMRRDHGLDNQMAAHLMTNPSTGHPEGK